MKLAWIDALRGLAILMVLANHVALVVPGLSAPVLAAARFGQMGVQLFFVVSAYTLCLSWQQRRGGEARPLLAFSLRRVFRIAPLYWFGIALFGLLDALQGSAESAYSASNLLANALFVHGFVPSAQNSIVPGGWSIGAEMAFYALFPLLVGLSNRRPGVAMALGLVLLASALNLLVQLTGQTPVLNNSFAYFHILNQLPVFLVGMALFQWQAASPAQAHRRASARVALATVAGLLLAAWLWRSGWALAFALLPAVVALALAALARLAAQQPEALWQHRPALALRALGQRSFAVYIIHVLFAWQGLHAWMAWRPLHGDLDYLLALAVVGLCSYGAAGVLERSIERPGMALGRRLIAALNRPAVVRA